MMQYFCKIEKEDNEYIAQFPDMANVVTCGFSLDEALYMAKDALNGCLATDLEQGMEIPPPKYTEGYPIEVVPHVAFAIRLRQLRGKETQGAAANRLGIQYKAYQRLEDPAKANPTIKTLEKIAGVYGKSVQALIG
jgi:antitoxin HicB